MLRSTCGLVAMTSAQHAEGRQFDPGQVYAHCPRWRQQTALCHMPRSFATHMLLLCVPQSRQCVALVSGPCMGTDLLSGTRTRVHLARIELATFSVWG